MRKIIFLLLICTTTITFSQKVIQDGLGRKTTPDFDKLQEEKIKLEKAYNDLTNGVYEYAYTYYPSRRNHRKDEIQAFLNRNETDLSYINFNTLLQKCKQLQDLDVTTGSNTRFCMINDTYKRIKSNIEYAKNLIIKDVKEKQNIEGEKQKEGREVSKHKSTLFNLDNELEQEEQLLAQSKKNLNQSHKKSKSLDDFLEEKGNVVKNKQTSNSTSLDSFLEEDEGNVKEFDDFLDDNNTDDIVSDDTSKSSKPNYKIDEKNGMQGVVSNKGKILIPYKKWIINEYRDGIAKVSILLTKQEDDCGTTHKANKIGFVDNSTQFIDGYTIDFETIGVLYYNNAFASLKLIYAVDETGWTRADYEAKYRRIEANKRRAKREKEEKERKERIKEAKCERATVVWKQQVLNQYQN
ncbi:MAG: hypothetical protein COA67_11075 [Lutibacter sp.]|nr:MAG: hypothetical protein COA67_11075 [Lutibacter sp.]